MTGVFRLALAVVLLLSGCLTAAPQAQPTPPPAEEGWQATAVRVEPLVHEIVVRDQLGWRACTLVLDAGCQGRAGGLGGSTGVEWEIDEHDYADPEALFWRFAVRVQWGAQAGEAVRSLHAELAVTQPCGVLCTQERIILASNGVGELRIEPRDIFLEPGETGLRLRLRPDDMSTPSTASIEYTLQGYAAGYRAAGPTILVA